MSDDQRNDGTPYVCDACHDKPWMDSCEGRVEVVCDQCGHEACCSDGFTPMWRHKTYWCDVKGKAKQRPRPKSEWLSVPDEHLRLIDEQLWLRVQSLRQNNEEKTTRFASSPW